MYDICNILGVGFTWCRGRGVGDESDHVLVSMHHFRCRGDFITIGRVEGALPGGAGPSAGNALEDVSGLWMRIPVCWWGCGGKVVGEGLHGMCGIGRRVRDDSLGGESGFELGCAVSIQGGCVLGVMGHGGIGFILLERVVCGVESVYERTGDGGERAGGEWTGSLCKDGGLRCALFERGRRWRSREWKLECEGGLFLGGGRGVEGCGWRSGLGGGERGGERWGVRAGGG